MKERKLISVLRDITPYEMNSFKKFYSSPFFNSNETLTLFLSILLDKYIKEDKHIEEHNVWKDLFPNEVYDDLKMRKLFSDGLKMFHSFLAQDTFQKEVVHQILLRIKKINDMKNELLQSDIQKEVERVIDRYESISSEQYLNKFLMQRDLHGIRIGYEKKHKSYKGDIIALLQSLENDLDQFYIIEKLRIFSTIITWSKSNKIDINTHRFISFIDENIPTQYLESPSIKMYINILHLLTSKNAHNKYLELKNLIKKHKYAFREDELKDLYEHAFSYSNRRLNQGDNSVLEEVFDLYKEALHDDVLLSDGELSPTTFRNITVLGLRCGQLEWTKNFIIHYAEKLNDKFRHNAVQFNMARYNFYMKNFWDAVTNLQRVNYDDIFYNLDSRILLIACYYELDEYDVMESQINSLNMFLRRNKTLSRDRKNIYLNYLKYVKKLSRINFNDKVKLVELKTDLENEAGVVNKSWILEKIQENVK
ncbi:MAG TPA: hypothetical protein PKC30_13245 [Saprospiraceae bacterium]|nr:hypothetical protein [Saprospiraceae bacterium]